MAQQKPIGFQLVDITTEQFALLEENFVESEQVSLKTGIDFKIDFDNKLLGCEAKFVFGQNEVMFLMIEVACHFEVKKKDWESFKKEERFVGYQWFPIEKIKDVIVKVLNLFALACLLFNVGS